MSNPFEGRQIRKDILAQMQCPGVTCGRTMADCNEPSHRRQGGVTAGSFEEGLFERLWNGKLSGGPKQVALRAIRAGLSGAARTSARAVRKAGRKEIPIAEWTASLSGMMGDIARLKGGKRKNQQWVNTARDLIRSRGAHTKKAVEDKFKRAPEPVKEVVRGYGYNV